MPQVMQVDSRQRNRTFAYVCCSVLFIIFVISVTVAATIQQMSDGQEEYLSELITKRSNSTLEAKSSISNNTLKASKLKRIDVHQTVPCLKTCRKYSAFRFKSSCFNGICKCNSPFYNTNTCLPIVDACEIRKTKPDVDSLSSLRYPLYSCHTINKDSNISTHVISMYGRTRHSAVKVKIKHSKTSKRKEINLVLANFLKTEWILDLSDAITVKTVYLISTKYLHQSTVQLIHYGDRILPTVIKKFSHVGYGDDVYNGYTVNLLRTINTDINQISSFSGIKYSPQWLLNV